MFNVYIMQDRRGPGFRLIPIVAKTAGGCTRDELPRENERVAKSSAAKLHGGTVADWHCSRLVGCWMERSAADIVRDHLAGGGTL